MIICTASDFLFVTNHWLLDNTAFSARCPVLSVACSVLIEKRIVIFMYAVYTCVYSNMHYACVHKNSHATFTHCAVEDC
jgi:hypothetical protein